MQTIGTHEKKIHQVYKDNIMNWLKRRCYFETRKIENIYVTESQRIDSGFFYY